MPRPPRPIPTWLRYLAAVLLVAAVVALRRFLKTRFDGFDGPPFMMMFAAVIAAAWFGGLRPGVGATVLGGAACDYFFIEPVGSIFGNAAGYDVRLALFVTQGLFVSWVIQKLRASSAHTRTIARNLRLIADNTSDAIFAYDMARQLLYVNPAFETLTGHSVNELRANPFMNYVHPDDSERLRRLIDGAFAGKRVEDVEYRILAYDGQVKWCRAAWGPLLDELGHQVGVQGRETDVTPARRSASTLHFLAETSTILSAVTDPAHALPRIAQAAVGPFADWCLIDLVQPDGSFRTAAAAHVELGKERVLAEMSRLYPPRLDATEGRGWVLRTGQPILRPAVTPELLGSLAADARHLKLLTGLAPRSALCVPLKTAGRVIGCMLFVCSQAAGRYSADDLVFATDLAGRIASALSPVSPAGAA